MSRIGKLPVKMIDGVQVTIAEDNLVTVKGPKGTLTKQLHPDMVLTQEEPEPYKGKGIRYEGEVVKLKAGKSGSK